MRVLDADLVNLLQVYFKHAFVSPVFCYALVCCPIIYDRNLDNLELFPLADRTSQKIMN